MLCPLYCTREAPTCCPVSTRVARPLRRFSVTSGSSPTSGGGGELELEPDFLGLGGALPGGEWSGGGESRARVMCVCVPVIIQADETCVPFVQIHPPCCRSARLGIVLGTPKLHLLPVTLHCRWEQNVQLKMLIFFFNRSLFNRNRRTYQDNTSDFYFQS